MLRTIEVKLYPTVAQADTLEHWVGACCWIYNRALEHRIKAYKRRGKSVSFYDQCAMLTGWRSRIERLQPVPAMFERDALRRLDRGFKAFFRRVKAGEKPGFPRFRARHRYNSLECLEPGRYFRPGRVLLIPRLGAVRFRGGDQVVTGKQKLVRVIRRAGGWFAQVLLDDGKSAPPKQPIRSSVGVDVGLESFATLSTGEKIDNPRCLLLSEHKLRRAQQTLSRCQRRSRNRRKALKRVRRIHERVSAQRRDFCHQQSRRLVNRFDLIGFENLNVSGMVHGTLAKSIHDAAWGMFLNQLTYKAEYAGKWAVPVNPRGTSQECPQCGLVKSKSLSERMHDCSCGLPPIDRDEAAGRVIESRALRVVGASACGGLTTTPGITPSHVGPMKQEGFVCHGNTPSN